MPYPSPGDSQPAAGTDLLRPVLDASPVIAWVKDPDGRYVFVSGRFEELVGSRDGGWLGRTDEELWPADVAGLFRNNDRAALDAGRALGLVESFARPDGSESRWWVAKFPVAGPGGHRLVGGVGVEVGGGQPRPEPLVTRCAWTGRLRVDGRWLTVEEFLRERLGVRVTYGISDQAAAEFLAEWRSGADRG